MITNCERVGQGPTDGAIDKTKLTSNPICATILARDAPGNMSQEPAIRIMGMIVVRIGMHREDGGRLWHTHDRFLRRSTVLEEFVESEAAGRHSGGILMWDPPAAEGGRLYSEWCGPDPPDHISIPIGCLFLARTFLFGTKKQPRSLCVT